MKLLARNLLRLIMILFTVLGLFFIAVAVYGGILFNLSLVFGSPNLKAAPLSVFANLDFYAANGILAISLFSSALYLSRFIVLLKIPAKIP